MLAMNKKALITGVTGQDGSYLAELLLEKNYEVHGMVRRSSIEKMERIEHIKDRLHLHYGDLADSMSLVKVIGTVMPDEIYNLAAQSHVQVSFDVPEYTADVAAVGVLRVLEAVRVCGLEKKCRIYQASTSELFEKWRRFRKMRIRRFTHTVLMRLQSSMGIGLSKNTGKLTACSAVLEYYLTMNRNGAARPL